MLFKIISCAALKEAGWSTVKPSGLPLKFDMIDIFGAYEPTFRRKKNPNILALKSGHFTISLYRALLHKEVDITYKNDQDHPAFLNLISLIYNLSIE